MSQIDTLVDMVGQLTETVNKTAERLEKVLTRHEEAIYGNAKPGLITRVTVVEQQQKGDTETRKTTEANRNRRDLVFLAAFLTTAGALMIKLFLN